jgi:hypothetical protein
LKKQTQRKQNQTVHAISILSTLLLENIDKLSVETRTNNRDIFKDHLIELEKICEIIVDGSAVKEVKNSTYVQEMVNKIDTIIRKNFRDI